MYWLMEHWDHENLNDFLHIKWKKSEKKIIWKRVLNKKFKKAWEEQMLTISHVSTFQASYEAVFG